MNDATLPRSPPPRVRIMVVFPGEFGQIKWRACVGAYANGVVRSGLGDRTFEQATLARAILANTDIGVH